jgi:deazaflavin-dependent oxidoreductase (nitroreductase family)
VTDAPHRPFALRLLGLGSRLAHRVSGGRVGSLEPGKQAPKGRSLQIITAVHRRLYRWTGGLVGSDVGGLSTLLLTTTGRKTGQLRTVPLPYFPHAEGWIVIASYAGNPENPAWYGNLVAKPEVTVQVKSRTFQATARTAIAEERRALWAEINALTPIYADYQASTAREIPLVVLRRAS